MIVDSFIEAEPLAQPVGCSQIHPCPPLLYGDPVVPGRLIVRERRQSRRRAYLIAASQSILAIIVIIDGICHRACHSCFTYLIEGLGLPVGHHAGELQRAPFDPIVASPRNPFER